MGNNGVKLLAVSAMLLLGCSKKPTEAVWEKLNEFPEMGITFSVQNDDDSAKVVSIKTRPATFKLLYNGTSYDEHLVQFRFNCTKRPVGFVPLMSIYSSASGLVEEPVPLGTILVVPDTPWEKVSRRVCA